MTYQEALEIAIADITTRINYLGERALEAHEDGEEEERAALRSAQGGMMECLELLTKLHALARSIVKDNAQAWCDLNIKMAKDAGFAEEL